MGSVLLVQQRPVITASTALPRQILVSFRLSLCCSSFLIVPKDRDLRSFFQAHFTRQEERESVFNTDVSSKLDKMNTSQEKMNESISAKLDKMNDSQNKMNEAQEKVTYLLAAILETLKK